MATYLNAPSGRFGTPTNAKKYTISTWLKLAVDSSDTNNFFNYNYGSGNQAISIQIRNNDQTLRINQYVPGTDTYDIRTNKVFRDPSAWYHIVIKYDSTQSTASDRVKIYVNGENQTSLAASSYPGQNVDSFIADTPNNNKGINIGGQWDGSGNASANSYFLGYMAQFIYTDGYAYDASTFGSTNANSIWVPNSSPSVTYGTNGFKLDFAGTGTTANASGFGADTSGNNNHFTATAVGTDANTKDSPQNNFCTMNSVAINKFNQPGLSRGNLSIFDTNNGNWRIAGATHGFTSGKWYWETKYSGANSLMVGIADVNNYIFSRTYATGGDAYPGRYSGSQSFGYRNNGTIYHNGNTTSGKTSWDNNGDFLGIALDMDNKALYAHVNGTYVDSGNPTSGASRTGSLFNFTPTHFVTPAFAVSAAGYNGGYVNFGNPITDGGITNNNSDANGYGKFQYAVPSGYYAICSKNLGTYG